jgi:uncharacterized membrane protein YeaQ/YmgE (transglycosylase-associated protein family)
MHRGHMANIIAALVGAAFILAFLGFYAVKIASLPLIVIIGAILIMVFTDFVQSLRSEGNDSNNSGD